MNIYYRVLLTLLLSVFIGCRAEIVNPSYSQYEPILAERSTLNTISFMPSQPIINAGKIYAYKSYILINEIDKGYHIIDNQDPAKPTPIGFLSVLASRDVSIQNDILFCNNATDLISINISDITSPRFLKRTVNIFPQQSPPDNLPLLKEYDSEDRPANTIVIEWRKRK